MSEISRFNINKVNIFEIPIWKTNIPILDQIYKPVVDYPGCVRVHRNNKTSLIDSSLDQYGTYTECGNFSIPSFEPLEYNPNEFNYVQSEKPKNQKQEIEERLEWIEEKLKDLYWFDAEVFKIYYREGFSLNQMQKETKINRNTLHKAITNVKKYLLNEKE